MKRITIAAFIVAGVIAVCSVLYSVYRSNEKPEIVKKPSKLSTTTEETRPYDKGEESYKEKRIAELEERIKELTERYESRIESLEALLAQEQPSALECVENAKIAEEALSETGIYGHVYGSDRRPIQWIDIWVTAEDTKNRQSVASDKDGYYEITNLRPGYYYAECELYPGDKVILEVILGKMTPQDFGSKGLGRLYGTVYDEKGNPVKVRVQLMGPQYNVIRAESDDYGNYEFIDLPREKYTVSICKGSLLPNIFSEPIEIPENTSEYKHDIHLSGLSISGRVFDEQTNKSLRGIKIQAHCEIGGGYGIVYTYSDEDGYYGFKNLASGNYNLQFWPQDYAYKAIAVTINQSITNYDIGLEPINPFWLLIQDQYGKGIRSHFKYSIHGTSINMSVGPCPPERGGFYAIRNVGPGEYTIGITADGYEPFRGPVSLPKDGYPKDEPFRITINKL